MVVHHQVQHHINQQPHQAQQQISYVIWPPVYVATPNYAQMQYNYMVAQQNYIAQQNYRAQQSYIAQQNEYARRQQSYLQAQQNYYKQQASYVDPLFRSATDMVGEKIGKSGRDVMAYMTSGPEGSPAVAGAVAMNPDTERLVKAVTQLGNDVAAGSTDRATAATLIGAMKNMSSLELNKVLMDAETLGTSFLFSDNLQAALVAKKFAPTLGAQTQGGENNARNTGRAVAGSRIPPQLRAAAEMVGGKIGLSADEVLARYMGKDGNPDVERLVADFPQHAQFFRQVEDIAKQSLGNMGGTSFNPPASAPQQAPQQTQVSGGVNIDLLAERSRQLANPGLTPDQRQALLDRLPLAPNSNNGAQNGTQSINLRETGGLVASTPAIPTNSANLTRLS